MNPDVSSPSARSPYQKVRGSITWTEGYEKNLHVLGKDQYPGRAMGVFTSGGDAQGSSKENYYCIILNPSVTLLLFCMHYYVLFICFACCTLSFT